MLKIIPQQSSGGEDSSQTIPVAFIRALVHLWQQLVPAHHQTQRIYEKNELLSGIKSTTGRKLNWALGKKWER